MNKKVVRLFGQFFILLISIMASCDQFHEDLILSQNEITLDSSSRSYYIIPAGSAVIDMKSFVSSSFINATLKLSERPTRGQLTFMTNYLWKYKPDSAFTDGSDQFSVVITSNALVRTLAITLRMIGPTSGFPCGGLYAVSDSTTILSNTQVEVHFLENDLLCGMDEKVQCTIYTKPSSGLAELVGDSTIRYTPEPEFHGRVEFLYEITRSSKGLTTTSYGLVSIQVTELLIEPPCRLPNELSYTLDLTNFVAPEFTIPECELPGFEIPYKEVVAPYCPDIVLTAYPGMIQTNHSGFFCVDHSGNLAYIPVPVAPKLNDTAKFNFQINNTPTTLTVYVNRAESTEANFAMYQKACYESDLNGSVFYIMLTSPAKTSGSITITTSWSYGTNYVTIPAASGNSFTLPIAANEDHASFQVIPIDNNQVAGIGEGYTINDNFIITSTSGGIQKGTRLNSRLMIFDDDSEFPCPISIPTEVTLDLTDHGDHPLNTLGECTGYDIEIPIVRDVSCQNLSVSLGEISETNHSGYFCMGLQTGFSYTPFSQAIPKNDTARFLLGVNDKYTIVTFYVIRE